MDALFAEGPLDWFPPWGSVRRWTGKTLNPFGLELVGRTFGFFDTAPLVELARKGVDFGAQGLCPGLRPAGRDQGSPEQWDRFRRDLLPEMLAAGQARRVVVEEEVAVTVVHPVAIVDKARTNPDAPVKSRMIHNLAGRLRDPSTGKIFPSFNDSTPHEHLPSVPLARVSDVVSALVLLASLGFQSTVHGGTIDLKAAYYQVALHASQFLLLGFLFEGMVYVVTGLPFGSKASPSIFCRFVNLIWYSLRLLRVLVFWYIDDAVVLGPTLPLTDKALLLTHTMLRFCGFTVNAAKSMATGARQFGYLGLDFDLDAWVIRIQRKSVDKLLQRVATITSRRLWPAFRLRPLLDSLIGLLNFMEVVIHSLRPYKHWVIGLRRMVSGCEAFTLSDSHVEFLETIAFLGQSRNSSPIWCREAELAKLHRHDISTDACETGFGGWGRTVAGEVIFFRGVWADLDGIPPDLVIADKELLAHAMAVEFLVSVVAPQARAVDLFIDNQNAQSWVNHLRCRVSDHNAASDLRFRFLRCYGALCADLNLAVSTSYINTKANKWADWLSRPDLAPLFDADVSRLHLQARSLSIPPGWYQAWLRRGDLPVGGPGSL